VLRWSLPVDYVTEDAVGGGFGHIPHLVGESLKKV
jgi:hypothetical protein